MSNEKKDLNRSSGTLKTQCILKNGLQKSEHFLPTFIRIGIHIKSAFSDLSTNIVPQYQAVPWIARKASAQFPEPSDQMDS